MSEREPCVLHHEGVRTPRVYGHSGGRGRLVRCRAMLCCSIYQVQHDSYSSQAAMAALFEVSAALSCAPCSDAVGLSARKAAASIDERTVSGWPSPGSSSVNPLRPLHVAARQRTAVTPLEAGTGASAA